MDTKRLDKFNEEAAAWRKARDEDYAEYEKSGKVTGAVPRERIAKLNFPRVKKEIIDGYLSIEDMTSTVSDILDSLGLDCSVPSSYVKSIIPGSKICGPAVTARNLPTQKTYRQAAMDKDLVISNKEHFLGEEGDIAVYDFGGNLDISCIGGNGCIICKKAGFAGSIIYGACRDINVIRDAGYPVFCSGTTQISGKYRIECVEINGPVNVFGKRVNAGDLIMADDSGVCIVPYELAERVLEKCLKI